MSISPAQALNPRLLAVRSLYSTFLNPQDRAVHPAGTPAARVRHSKVTNTFVREFIDHRTIVINFALAPLARLQLARAYAMQGDAVRAKAAYQDFLTLWKDADPDIPILKQAKAEYAKLQ